MKEEVKEELKEEVKEEVKEDAEEADSPDPIPPPILPSVHHTPHDPLYFYTSPYGYNTDIAAHTVRLNDEAHVAILATDGVVDALPLVSYDEGRGTEDGGAGGGREEYGRHGRDGRNGRDERGARGREWVPVSLVNPYSLQGKTKEQHYNTQRHAVQAKDTRYEDAAVHDTTHDTTVYDIREMIPPLASRAPSAPDNSSKQRIYDERIYDEMLPSLLNPYHRH